jgi:hypothetical protein
MLQIINESVKVAAVFNPTARLVFPKKISWQGRTYLLEKLNYYHRIREGRTFIHVFHVSDHNLDFRLHLNGETLSWTLVEIADGEAA